MLRPERGIYPPDWEGGSPDDVCQTVGSLKIYSDNLKIVIFGPKSVSETSLNHAACSSFRNAQAYFDSVKGLWGEKRNFWGDKKKGSDFVRRAEQCSRFLSATPLTSPAQGDPQAGKR
jgi:hypothetical protein